jgi:hypothetical protein
MLVIKLLYWLAVLVVSFVLVVGLILFFESRDQSSVEGALRGVEAGGRAVIDSVRTWA